MFGQSILLTALWITFTAAAPFDLNGGTHVSEIMGCAYVDAYYVTCWWVRPEGDASTKYRLGFTTDADHPHERREKYCDSTQQIGEDGVTIEKCGIRGTMFQRFTLWVGAVEECYTEAGSCVTTHRSKEILFTATRDNVKLTIPPNSVSVDDDGQRLFWYPPEKEHSMLSFVVHRRRVMYKVEYRESTSNEESEWNEWYRGYETSVFLPTFTAGSMYEVRVSASLDPPTLPTLEQNYKREWTEPSTVLAFRVPTAMKSTAEGNIVEIKKNDTISESTDLNVTVEDTVSPLKVSERVIVAASVSSFILILILALLWYFVPWQRWCCNIGQTKPIKPKTFLDFAKSSDSLNRGSAPDTDKSEQYPREVVFPITDIMDWEYETCNRAQSRRNIVLSLTKKKPEAPEYARQRLLSPSSTVEQAFSLSDILDHVPLHDDDTISESDFETATEHKKEDENVPKSERYVKSGQETEMPNYLMTSKNDEMVSGSLDRSSSEYVVDDTGIESAFGDITAASTFEEYEEKQKQWEKFMLDQAKSDDVPDYVMQGPSFASDLARDMTMFISVATEDLAKRQSMDISGSSKKPVVPYEETILPCLRDDNEAEGSSSQFVIMTLCSSCKTSKNHEKCPNGQSKSNLEVETTLNKHGSTSQHSIDSGYSPDSPDCAVLSQSDKENLLPQLFERRGSAAVDDDDNGESDTDYMTYVST